MKLLVVGAMLALAGAALTGLARPAEATQGLTLRLAEIGDSGVSGTVTLTEAGSDVDIEVRAFGLVYGESYLSGAYKSTSVDCRGGLIQPFAEAVVTGTGGIVRYTVPGPIEDIFSVSVRKGTEPPGSVVACAERSRRSAISAPSTGSGGLLSRENGSSYTTAAIILAAAAVLLTSGRAFVRRLDR